MDHKVDILNKTVVGIDYGSKYAGTTVICYNAAHKVHFLSSSKNSDADSFLLTELAYLDPDLIMIDAPLTLPGVFWLGNGYTDHFFRKCDRELRAMSPMFLGGLTARAMQLQKYMNGMGSRMLETYPRKLAEIFELPMSKYGKKKADLPVLVGSLVEKLGVSINSSQISSWHHFDALLAFLSGIRHLEEQSLRFGIEEEGLVTV